MEILEEREFIVEVGNFYRIQSEELEKTPYEIHGFKNFPQSHPPFGDSWSDEDWIEFLGILKTDNYIFIIKCLSSKY